MTTPPPKFPGYSGENVFCTRTLSKIFVGNKSKGTTLLNGSGEAIEDPSRRAVEYLSPKPLTKIYLSFTKLNPETLFSASAILLSPASDISVELITLDISEVDLFSSGINIPETTNSSKSSDC